MDTTHTKKKNVVFSFLGIEKDQKESTFRPNIELCEQDNLHIDELYLFHQPNHSAFGEEIKAEIKDLSKGIHVELVSLERDAFTLDSVFPKLKTHFSNFQFKHEEANYYLHLATGTHIELICFFLLAEWNSFTLLQTIPKNNNPSSQINTINLREERYLILNEREIKTETEKRQLKLKQGIQTQNKAFNTLIEEIEEIAAISPYPILLMGPTGAGKTQLAKQIAQLNESPKKKPTFIAVNCATLTGDLAQSSLFGYKKGAFTGAIEDYQGYLEQADGGTLFLDEIGELPLETQAMLLKAIEEHKFYPLGSNEIKEPKFRLICGTNRDLEEQVQKGTFRKDLLERINVWSYRLPGLAERREDIDPNIDYELSLLNNPPKDEERPNNPIAFTEEAREHFLRYALNENTRWEGNFREFHKMFLRMGAYAQKDGNRITFEIVEREIDRNTKKTYTPTKVQKEPPINLKELLGDTFSKYGNLDLQQLEYIITICKSSKTRDEAGQKLFKAGLTNYSDRISKALGKFNLKWDNVKNA